MRIVTVMMLLVVLVVPTTAGAAPVRIDLTPERKDYEAKAHPRYFGLGLLAGTLVLGIGSAYGFTQASAAREELLAQRAPIDLGRRQDLIGHGERSQALGFGAALLGIGAAIGSAYFLSVTF